ncbi:MAG: metallopeptidase TldD-related protein [Firmicutes bacterium]|nr:metallopeptidase TldD-related protein [[Eubacterium] siraeum]MCM1488431.1 metallopeptidase TldD-related protein [Bacillota bacterium]
MINKIIEILRSRGIEKYLINKTEKSSSELFFIRKKLDVRRSKDITDYDVTVYRDIEKDGKKLRGSASVGIFPTMTEAEIDEKLKDAYFAAQFAANPFYDLVKGEGKETVRTSSEKPDTEAAVKAMSEALFSADTDGEAFINSAEFFAENERIRVINSDGVDVSFDKFNVNGEFVTQCKTEEDVELHYSFKYDCVNEKALAEMASEGIKSAKDRSVAKRTLESGNYDVILSGKELAAVLSYYTDRSNAAYIYPHYSDYKVGDHIQGDDVTGEKLKLTLIATQPYSEEGVEMKDLPLAENGELKAIHGGNRFSQYLGIKPSGFFEKIRLEAGTKSLAEMKEKPYLQAVKFSDFQMDSFTGHFGGEIRLAYLCDGEKITKVTGGSINGIITKAHKNLVFSTETYSDSSYEGPLAVRIENVAVAGSN